MSYPGYPPINSTLWSSSMASWEILHWVWWYSHERLHLYGNSKAAMFEYRRVTPTIPMLFNVIYTGGYFFSIHILIIFSLKLLIKQILLMTIPRFWIIQPIADHSNRRENSEAVCLAAQLWRVSQRMTWYLGDGRSQEWFMLIWSSL